MSSLIPTERDWHNTNHPIPGPALLRAATGVYGPSTYALTPVPQAINQPVATVTLDSNTLYNATVLVDFAGILTTTVTAATALILNFTLFKTCKGTGVRQPVKNFTFTQNIPLTTGTTTDSRTLKFEYSQCDDFCDTCCQYSLELTNLSTTTGTTAAPTTVTVSINGILSVLAVALGC